MTAPSSFKFALACGPGGSYVDVTGDVLFEEGSITFQEGRASMFDPINPGSFPLTLANGDGKYTPDNPSSSLAVKLTEGMSVCMQLDGLLISGTVREIGLIFPSKESASEARVRLAVTDVLTDLARQDIPSLPDALIGASGPYLWWPFDESAGGSATFSREATVRVRVWEARAQRGLQTGPRRTALTRCRGSVQLRSPSRLTQAVGPHGESRTVPSR